MLSKHLILTTITFSGVNKINSAKIKMKPNKIGQVAKCNTCLPDENPEQL